MEIDKNKLKELIYKVSDEFYELVFQHPWLKEVFKEVDQQHITNQQTDFMWGAMGGEKTYGGRNPKDAHPHIYIQEDMWDVRESLLIQAMEKTNTPEDIKQKWLTIDRSFKERILKKSLSECKGRFKTDPIINVPNPNIKKVA